MVFLHVLVVFFSLIFHGLSFIFHWFSCPFPKNIKHRWEHHLGDPDPMILDWSKQGVYYVFNWCEATFSWCHCQAANLADYQGLRYKIPDLAQMARNDRGCGETTDGALPTLTTNSGKLYHKVFWVLFLETDETQQCQYKINLTICLQRHCAASITFKYPLVMHLDRHRRTFTDFFRHWRCWTAIAFPPQRVRPRKLAHLALWSTRWRIGASTKWLAMQWAYPVWGVPFWHAFWDWSLEPPNCLN